ncbi:RHS repeat-associated core domain-containing protein [Streptomyces sp. NPDC012616]|uniref:RHS repeat-associated core domain-containing protein n=1 Tax=Streptomyces sp. NPDC012616 TaxID=3364840 RepID=UPI0036E0F6C6
MAGQPCTRRSCKPYGETRSVKPSAWPNVHTYLGAGIDDTATALTHLGTRAYDPSTGRFISADPVIDMGDPLQVNGCAYSRNL